MLSKNVNYYLVKAARITGWLLFSLMLLYIVTGFSIRGEFGLNRLIDLRTAAKIHIIFEWPLIAVFCVHSVVMIYFAFRRWGWINRRPRT